MVVSEHIMAATKDLVVAVVVTLVVVKAAVTLVASVVVADRGTYIQV